MSREGFKVNPEDVKAGRITNPDKAEAMARASNEYRTKEAEITKKGKETGFTDSMGRNATGSRAEEIEKREEEVYKKGIGIGGYSINFSPEMREMVQVLRQDAEAQAENMSLERIEQEIRLSSQRTEILKEIAERRSRDINQRMPGKEDLEAEARRLTQEIKDKLDKAV